MAQWPSVPLEPIPDSGASWPARVEVGPLTLVGPTGENQQPAALETRTETIRLLVNQLLDMLNRIRDFFLDRDGTLGSATQPGVWMRGDFDMGLKKIVKLAAATSPRDVITFAQLQAVLFEAEDELEQILDTRVVKLDGSAQMGAALNMSNLRVTNLGAAVSAQDMMRRDTVDAALATLLADFLPRNGGLPMDANLNFDGPEVTHPGFIPINVGVPTSGGDLVNKEFLDDQVSLFGGQDVPVGTVIPYAGPEGSIPTNFLLCDGREVSRFVYQNLFNIVGIAYGTPSSSSVFRLPDLRGRIVVGIDNMGGVPANRITGVNALAASTLGGQFGLDRVTLTPADLPSHTHTYDDHIFTSGAGGAQVGGDDGTDTDNVQADIVRTSTSSGTSTPHNNVQPSFAANYLVRY